PIRARAVGGRGPKIGVMGRGDVMVGSLATLSWAGMLGLGGWWASGHGFREPDGLPRSLGAAVVAWAWATIGAPVLGLSGALGRGPLLAWAAAGLALGGLVRVLAPPSPGGPESRGEPLDGSATVALALTLWTIVLVGIPTWLQPERTISDGPIYHLSFA